MFLDGDFSYHPEEMDRLVDPLIENEADLVIGSRVLGHKQPGALIPQARFGNWLAGLLIRLLWQFPYTDLGPFRDIRFPALLGLTMMDRDYGWTVEIQIKAAAPRLRIIEVPVSHRRRLVRSKISGTIRGIFGAGTKLLATIAQEAGRSGRGHSHPSI